jgi:hypothetical protein
MMLNHPTIALGVQQLIAASRRHRFFCLLMLLLLAGCSRSGELKMSTVSGNVTYRGKPIQEGEIRFIPTGDTKGPTSAGSILDGRYEVTARGGVPVGTHRVEVRAFRVKSSPKPTQDLPGMAPGGGLKEQYLPKQYNERSDLKATIDSGRSKVTRDFDLKD